MKFWIGFIAVSLPMVSAWTDEIKPLIVGGIEAPVGQRTWVTGLRTTLEEPAFCGATLIAPTKVLSAAHCGKYYGKYAVIGSHFWNGTSDGEQLEIVKQTIHPNYKNFNKTNDLMVLELAQPSSFKPVDLVQTEDKLLAMNDQVTVLGWGKTQEGGEESQVLRQVSLQVWENPTCDVKMRKYDKKRGVDDTMVCAGGLLDVDSCQGDSGGPLIQTTKDGRDVLVGVVSWGRGCGRDGVPGVYSRVTANLDFIYQNAPELKPTAATA
jgi:trypsin